jgi:hypothetical protein
MPYGSVDRPFHDVEHAVVGFYVIEAPDADAALAIAKTNPVVADGGCEIREIHSMYVRDAPARHASR